MLTISVEWSVFPDIETRGTRYIAVFRNAAYTEYLHYALKQVPYMRTELDVRAFPMGEREMIYRLTSPPMPVVVYFADPVFGPLMSFDAWREPKHDLILRPRPCTEQEQSEIIPHLLGAGVVNFTFGE